MRRTVPWILAALLAALCLLEAALLVRAHEHSAYYRSRAAEYERLAQLHVEWPAGSEINVFLEQIGWRSDDPRIQVDSENTTVAVRPQLRIPIEETRDYSGFLFSFRDGALLSIEPLGPEGTAPLVDLLAAPSSQPVP